MPVFLLGGAWPTTGYEPLELDIYVVCPTREHLPERTRRFLEFLKRWAKTRPDWTRRAALKP